jgi:hypothetical protein
MYQSVSDPNFHFNMRRKCWLWQRHIAHSLGTDTLSTPRRLGGHHTYRTAKYIREFRMISERRAVTCLHSINHRLVFVIQRWELEFGVP